jgi:hypothetical protein
MRGPDEFSVHCGHTFDPKKGYEQTFRTGLHVVRIDHTASGPCDMELTFLNSDGAAYVVPGEYVLWPVGKVKALVKALEQIVSIDWSDDEPPAPGDAKPEGDADMTG